MFSRRTLTVWTGIIILSSMFLMGQEPWAPSDLIYCEDTDSDGYGVRPALLCPFALYLDCDDTDPDVNPAATEICNGIDDNCDTLIDVVDADGDTYFLDMPPCTGTDCDDTNPNIHPGAVEACDGVDSDCDGITPVDETDADADHYVACGPYVGTLPGILGGYDCNDSRSDVSPGLIEAPWNDPICSDGLDNDCDALTDLADNGCQQCTLPQDCDDTNPCTVDDCVGSLCQYTYNTIPCDDADPCTMNDTCSLGTCTGVPLDEDGDSYFSGTPPCTGTDCDDTNPNIHPGAGEACDGVDSDCDGVTPVDETDADTDQYVACGPYVGTLPGILGGDDCDDSRSDVNPGLVETPWNDPICSDGLDNDCDAFADITDNGCQQCTLPADCDDTNPCTVDDCVGYLCQYTYNTIPCDDADTCTMNDTCSLGTCTGVPLDEDGDTYVSDACPPGDDCLDSDPDVNPGATEGPPGDPTCSDLLDNDCDGLIDTAADPDCVTTP